MVHDDLLLDGLVQGQAEVLHLVGRGSTNLHHIGYSLYWVNVSIIQNLRKLKYWPTTPF